MEKTSYPVGGASWIFIPWERPNFYFHLSCYFYKLFRSLQKSASPPGGVFQLAHGKDPQLARERKLKTNKGSLRRHQDGRGGGGGDGDRKRTSQPAQLPLPISWYW